ncbi:hypothetical protein QTP88_010857 [Uroleucon formosanum]
MCAAIENPTSCDVRSVIRFLLAKNLKPIDIYRQLREVYGDYVMNESSVRKWCIQFKNGRTNVHDEEKSGRPSIVTDDLVAKVNEKIRENRRFTITELSLCFPQISRTLLFEIFSQKLGYDKFCARWVPKLFTDHHKGQRLEAALTFLNAYHTHAWHASLQNFAKWHVPTKCPHHSWQCHLAKPDGIYRHSVDAPK